MFDKGSRLAQRAVYLQNTLKLLVLDPTAGQGSMVELLLFTGGPVSAVRHLSPKNYVDRYIMRPPAPITDRLRSTLP